MRFTVREFVEAAAKNGLPHIRGSWFDYEKGTDKLGGCIMGQAAYNLIGTEDENEADTIFSLVNEATNGSLDDIITLNDSPRPSGKYRPYSDLVKALRSRTKDYLDRVVEYIPEKDEEPDW